MRIKKFIKLINNERSTANLTITKACDESSHDVCNVSGYDNARCTVNSYDVCDKDYAACFNNGYDYCNTYRDTDLCIGSYDYN